MQVPARFRSQRFDMAFIAADLSSNNFVPTLSAVSDGQAPLIDGQDWLSGDKNREAPRDSSSHPTGAHKEVRYGKSAKITAPTVWLLRMSRSSTSCLRKRSHSEDTRWESFLRAMPHRENAGEAEVQVRPVEQCVETFGVRG